MATSEQNLGNHARLVPLYHFWTFFPLVINFGWAIYGLVRGVNGDSIVQALLAFALLCMFLSIRQQILTVQDRVIRNEMRERLSRVLPPAQHGTIAQLTHKQLVALRFASDAELPALVQQVVAGGLTSQKDIKSQVRNWQADYLRA